MNEDKLLHCNFSIEKSKDGNDILLINDKYIHSKFTPLKEANDFNFKGVNLIVIFGIGFAYHVNNIIRNNPDSFFIIFEPIHDIYDLSQKYIDKKLFETHKNKICFLRNIDTEIIFSFIKNNFCSEMRIKTFSNLGYKSLFSDLEAEYFDTIKMNFETVIQNILTESNFIPLWTKNFLLNIRNLENFPFFNPKKQDLGTNVAVIVCAGPSLKNDLKNIKENRNKITIFAVDTAIKPLIESEIIPDFIVSLDGQYYSIDDFVKNMHNDTALLLDAVSYPGISRLYKNIYYTVTENIFDNNIIEYFFKYNSLNKFGLSTGGNVSDYAASIAISLGFNNIYFTGLDLSFPLLQTHCINSPFYYRALNSSDYYNTMDSIFIKIISKRSLKNVESKVNGKLILTDFVLQNYAFYFNNLAQAYKSIKIFNSRFNGMRINNLIEKDLNIILKENESKHFKYRDLIRKNNLINIKKDQIDKFYNKTVNLIHKRAVELDKMLSSTNFNQEDNIKLNQWKILINNIFNEFPFLKKFILMTMIILQKKNITDEYLLYYKHVGHKTLQSIYFVIRVFQKLLK